MRNNFDTIRACFSIVLATAMLFSTMIVFSGEATAEPIETVDNSIPPIPPFTIFGIIYGEPASDATVTITNIRTDESLKADVYENGAYECVLEDLPSGYEMNDEIEIEVTKNTQTISKVLVVKQIGFGERVDIYFGDSKSDAKSGTESSTTLNNALETTTMGNEPLSSNSEPVENTENSEPIIIDPQIQSSDNKPVAEITLTDMRAPPYYRLAFTDKENDLRFSLRNEGDKRVIVIVDLYHVEPDGITESFLKTVHFGTLLPGREKFRNVFEDEEGWIPTQTGRNWIRGEIYIKGHGNERIFVNEFKESFNVVPGWRPVLELGSTVISELTIWENLTVIIDGDVVVNAPLYIRRSDVIAGDFFVNALEQIDAGSSLDLAASDDGEFKVQVNSSGTFNVFGRVWNNPDNFHYWFYMNGTLEVDGGAGGWNGTIENTHGPSDLSQPGGIICTTDNVLIENGATVRYGKTHGIWLENSDTVIRDSFVCDNGGDGIVVVDGSAPVIEGNTIEWNNKSGINVDNSTPLIKGNTAIQWNGGHGINVKDIISAGAKIEGNIIDKNFGSGIYAINANLTISNNTISSNGQALVYRDDMEGSVDNWTASGLWHRVSNESGTAPSWNLSHSGDWCWWYGNDTTHDYNTSTRNFGNLTSPNIDVTNATSVALTFWSWYETDTSGTATDNRNVTIYNETFGTTVYQLQGDAMNEWTRYVLDISDYAGMNITVNFSFDSVNALNNDYQGWYIDDFEVISVYPAVEGYGISVQGTKPSIIYKNNITANNWDGIYLNKAENSTIYENNITNNRGMGVNILKSHDNNISYNKFLQNEWAIFFENGASSNNLIDHNSIDTPAQGGVYGRGLYRGHPGFSNNTFSNNWINHTLNSHGFYFIHVEYNLFTNNYVNDTAGVGIRLQESYHNTVSFNHLNNSYDWGIGADYRCSHTLIENNDVRNSGYAGISASGGRHHIVRNNTVQNVGRYGIQMIDKNPYYSPDFCIVENNTVLNSGDAGILIEPGLHNVVQNNTVDNCARGIYFDGPTGNWSMFRGSSSNLAFNSYLFPSYHVSWSDGLLESEKPREEQWSFQTDDAIRASPVIVEHVAYVKSTNGTLYAIEETTGNQIWKYETGISFNPGPIQPVGEIYFDASPCVWDNNITICSDSQVYTLNKNTGSFEWSISLDSPIISSPIYHSDRLIICTFDGYIYSLYLDDGAVDWYKFTGDSIVSTPCIAGSSLIIRCWNGTTLSLNFTNGNENWNLTFESGAWSSPLYTNNIIFFGTYQNETDNKSRIYMLNISGNVLYEHILTDTRIIASPSYTNVWDDLVFFATEDGAIYECETDGSYRLHTIPYYGQIISSTFTTMGHIVFTTTTGTIVNYGTVSNLNVGEIWSDELGAQTYSSPSVAYDKIFIGSDSGKLHCFYKPSANQTFANNTFTNCDLGVQAESQLLNMENNIIENGTIGVWFTEGIYSYGDKGIIENNSINNYENGARFDMRSSPVLTNNFINNMANGTFIESSSPTIINTTISNCSSHDFYLAAESHPTALNTSFNDTKASFNDEISTLTVQWFMDVKVVNNTFDPVNGASVWVNDTFGNPEAASTTDADGWLRWIRATEYVQNWIDTIYHTAHNITASNATLTGWAMPEPFMDRNRDVYVLLGEGKGYNIFLHEGWNLISIPYEPYNMSSDNILDVLRSIDGKWDNAKWWDAADPSDPWKGYSPLKPPSLNDLTHINHTMGFWIHTLEPCTLLNTGNKVSPVNIVLQPGWNMVGYPTDNCSVNISTAFVGIEAYRDTPIEGYDSTDPYLLQQLPEDYILRPSEGYWVHVNATCVWTVNW